MSNGSGGHPNPWLIAIFVTIAAFMEVLDTTIVNVALPYIAGSLAVSSDDATWCLTTYLVANGVVLTISGSLSRRIGRKKYFLISIAGFTACSLACGISTNFIELLLFRGLQGVFGGGLQPTQQAIILDTFPPAQRQQGFTLTAIATILAPVIGPAVGGYITDQATWHWVFLINIPIGLVALFGVSTLLPTRQEELEQAKRAPPFDFIGTGFVVLALGAMELAADRGEDADWLGSPAIRVLVIVSAVGYVFGIFYLIYARNPVVDLRVFRDRNFALAWFCIAMMGFVLYASAVLIPQYAQQQLGYSATLAGLVLTPGAVVLVMLIPVAGKSLDYIPVKYVIAAGGVALAGSLFYSNSLVPNMDFFHLALYRSAQTASLALLFSPISTAAYSTLPKDKTDDGAALFSMARNVYGGVGISISTALITQREQARQNYLVDHLTSGDQGYNSMLQSIENALVSAGTTMQQAMMQAPGQVNQMLRQQVATLAYNDVFLITGALALLITVAALLMSGVKPKSSGGAE